MNISLVIPFYNDYPLLGSALQSVYRQSLIPNEKILVYNGSHLEDAEKLIKQLLEIYKPLNMRLITAGPVGLPAARNIGIQNSSSEYICFLDVDDAMSFNMNFFVTMPILMLFPVGTLCSKTNLDVLNYQKSTAQ